MMNSIMVSIWMVNMLLSNLEKMRINHLMKIVPQGKSNMTIFPLLGKVLSRIARRISMTLMKIVPMSLLRVLLSLSSKQLATI
jgi:hypothetical protein